VNRGAKAHPPKKKHKNKPRSEPAAPWSDEQRSTEAWLSFERAMLHLGEAEQMATWGKAPNACIHAAYYAMYHCAIAAILASGGVGRRRNYPLSHEHIIEHYSKLVSGEPGDLGQTGVLINRARSERVTVDYGAISGAEVNDAADTTADAKRFIEAVCAK